MIAALSQPSSFGRCHPLFPILPAALLRCFGAILPASSICLYCDRPPSSLFVVGEEGGPRLIFDRSFSPDPGNPNVGHQILRPRPCLHRSQASATSRLLGIILLCWRSFSFRKSATFFGQWQFQSGTLLGLVAPVGVFWFQPGLRRARPIHHNVGCLLGHHCWALYGVLVKTSVRSARRQAEFFCLM